MWLCADDDHQHLTPAISAGEKDRERERETKEKLIKLYSSGQQKLHRRLHHFSVVDANDIFCCCCFCVHLWSSIHFLC